MEGTYLVVGPNIVPTVDCMYLLPTNVAWAIMWVPTGVKVAPRMSQSVVFGTSYPSPLPTLHLSLLYVSCLLYK